MIIYEVYLKRNECQNLGILPMPKSIWEIKGSMMYRSDSRKTQTFSIEILCARHLVHLLANENNMSV